MVISRDHLPVTHHGKTRAGGRQFGSSRLWTRLVTHTSTKRKCSLPPTANVRPLGGIKQRAREDYCWSETH